MQTLEIVAVNSIIGTIAKTKQEGKRTREKRVRLKPGTYTASRIEDQTIIHVRDRDGLLHHVFALDIPPDTEIKEIDRELARNINWARQRAYNRRMEMQH